MADSECIKEVVNQAAMQATSADMMAFRDMDTWFQPATTPNQWEAQRERHGRLILEKPKFSLDGQDRYIEL